jgi:L-ascorbate metabolism protein UlaG (beta-lactamase superfamily)
MKIQFVKHSCFVVTLSSAILIFDYAQGELPEFDGNLPVYVFASHAHGDHFNPEIIEKTKQLKQVTYVFSGDIPVQSLMTQHPIVSMNADESRSFPELAVSTLKSTDEGVAFVIETEGKCIYFAGDLHWWTWKGETDEAEAAMKDAFFNEINKIRGKEFDLAFLVLDPRQEERYWWGFDAFMRTTQTRYALPMHSWGKYDLVDRLIADPVSEPYRQAILPVHEKGEIFSLGVDSKARMV